VQNKARARSTTKSLEGREGANFLKNGPKYIKRKREKGGSVYGTQRKAGEKLPNAKEKLKGQLKRSLQ